MELILVKMHKESSPKDSLNFNVLQQATLFYQGKTAFDFNSDSMVVFKQIASLIDAIETLSYSKVKESIKIMALKTS